MHRIALFVILMLIGTVVTPISAFAEPSAAPSAPLPSSSPQLDADLQQKLDAGEKAYAIQDYARALQYCEAGLANARRRNNTRYVAYFLNNLGIIETKLGRYADALSAHQQALAIDRDIHNRLGEANALNNIGIVETKLGRYADALTALQRALAIHRDLNNRLGEANDLGNIGIVEDDLGRYADALAAQQQSLAIDRDLHNRLGEANALGNIGNVERELGRYANALTTHQQALAIDRDLNNRLGEADDLGNIGIVEEAFGRYADALTVDQQALAIHRDLHNRLGEANGLANIGNVERELGRYADALTAHQQALVIHRDLPSRLGEARDLDNIGIVERELGRYADALTAHQQALAIHRDLRNRLGEANALGNIGIVERELGRYSDALTAHEQALAIDRDLHSRPGEADDLGNIGIVENDLGRDANALTAYQQALAIYRDLHNRLGEANDLGNIGNVEENRGRYADALIAHQQALAIHRDIHNRLGETINLTSIANVEMELGRYSDAYREVAASVATSRALGNADVWRSLQLLAFAETKLRPGFEADAQAHYEEALVQIERLRAGVSDERSRTSFFGTKLFVYDQYIAYLLELNGRHPGRGYDRKALEVFERRSARAALEQISASAAQHFVGVSTQVVAQDDATDSAVMTAQSNYTKLVSGSNPDATSLSSAKATLETSQRQQAALQSEIQTRYPQYYALRHPQPISVDSLQRDVLRSGEVMLIYDVLPAQSALWILSRDRFGLITVPGSKALETAVSALRRHVELVDAFRSAAAADIAGFARDSNALYDQVVPPAALPLLVGAKHLVVVPSGSLFQVPFEALVTGPPTSGSSAPHYLIQDLPISYVPSASLLGVVRRSYTGRQPAPRALLAFAPFADAPTVIRSAPPSLEARTYAELQLEAMRAVVPHRGRPGTASGTFSQLPGSQDEVQQVQAALGAPAASVLVREDASRQRIMTMNDSGELKTIRYVLFATHAVLPEASGGGLTQPAIVLAHPERGDGFLTMADVFGLYLNADFVALSACDTGVVTDPRGDGISGLTRAFLYAGTPAISVTLWPVDDAAGPRISPPFFAAMRAGKSSADALREAQLAMISAADPVQSHPYEWAPFVIFGEGDLVAAQH